MMEINNFRGELNDISAYKTTIWCTCRYDLRQADTVRLWRFIATTLCIHGFKQNACRTTECIITRPKMAKHSNNDVFVHCFRARCKATACKMMQSWCAQAEGFLRTTPRMSYGSATLFPSFGSIWYIADNTVCRLCGVTYVVELS